MGYLTIPFRVVYESKSFRQGLTNVVAFVIKPNNSIAGPYPMTEFPSPFLGRYFFDFITNSLDPEGEYFVAIYSPSDSTTTTKRVSLYLKPASQASLDAAATSISDELEEISDQVDFITANVI